MQCSEEAGLLPLSSILFGCGSNEEKKSSMQVLDIFVAQRSEVNLAEIVPHVTAPVLPGILLSLCYVVKMFRALKVDFLFKKMGSLGIVLMQLEISLVAAPATPIEGCSHISDDRKPHCNFWTAFPL